MRLSVVLGVLLLLPAVALGSRVSGTVVDVKGKPFADAAVDVVEPAGVKVVARGKADAEGQFRFDLPPGSYQLQVKTPELCSTHARALAVKEDEDAALPLRLPRCVRVTGRAWGEEGTPLARGTVTLHWLRFEGPDQTATLDAEGRFHFARVPQGAVRVFLKDGKGRELLPTVRLTAPRELEVRGERMLQVLIGGPTGAPLTGAELLLVPERRDGINLRRRTDERGLAGVPVPPPGRYRLLVSWEEEQGRFLRYVWRDVELKADADPPNLSLSFAERPALATLSGTVRGPDGLPIPNVEVTAVQRFPSVPLDDDFLRDRTYPVESATLRTDANGNFTLSDLREGEYALTVESPRARVTVLAKTGGPPTQISLVPECAESASGRVVDEQGAPVQRFNVSQTPVEDSKGRFHVQRDCSPLIEADGFLPRRVVVPASPLQQVTLPDVVLVRGRQLVGRVVHPDGTPEVGYTLTAYWKGVLLPPESKPSDTRGRFSLGAVPRDTEVLLKSESENRLLLQRVPPNLKGEVLFRLPALDARLHVRALSADGSPLAGVEVIAENATGTFKGRTKDAAGVSLKLPAGTYDVRGVDDARREGPHGGISARFAPLKVQVPAKGTTPLEVRATQGTGTLRVLMPRGTHYDDVYVFPGVQPWPGDFIDLDRMGGRLAQDVAQDYTRIVGGNRELSFLFYTVLADFSALVPGRYTVFAKDSYGGTVGRSKLFRQVIDVVEGPKRQVIQVRFEGPEVRELPW